MFWSDVLGGDEQGVVHIFRVAALSGRFNHWYGASRAVLGSDYRDLDGKGALRTPGPTLPHPA